MRYRRDGEWRSVSRITGPAHNLLELRLVRGRKPVRVQISAKGEKGPVSSSEVLVQVKHSLRQANKEFGTDYEVEAVRFDPADTPSPTVYAYLARAILKHAVAEDAASPPMRAVG